MADRRADGRTATWTGAAALVGLALAALTLTAAVPTPPIGRPIAPAQAAPLLAAVENGPWIARRAADNRCPKLYMLDSRTCPYCMAFMRQHYQALEQSGYDVRLHYAPVAGDDLRAIAEIGTRRDIAVLLAHQLRTRVVTGPDPAATGGARLDAFNAMVETTNAIRNASRAAGFSAYLPTFVWQDRAGRWRVESGMGAATVDQLRASLPAPAAACRAG